MSYREKLEKIRMLILSSKFTGTWKHWRPYVRSLCTREMIYFCYSGWEVLLVFSTKVSLMTLVKFLGELTFHLKILSKYCILLHNTSCVDIMQNNGFSFFPSYLQGRAFILGHPVFSGAHKYAWVFMLQVEMRAMGRNS